MDQFLVSGVTQWGVSLSDFYYLLVVPLIVFSAAFARNVLGIKLMGLNILLMLTYFLVLLVPENTAISVIVGALIAVVVYFASYYVKRFTTRLGLHYSSRTGMVFTVVAIALVGVLSLVWYLLDLSPFRNNTYVGYQVDFVAGVILIFLVEYFAAYQSRKGLKISFGIFLNTLVLAMVIAVVVSFSYFKLWVVKFPVSVLVFIFALYLVGRYKGLRLREFLRFNPIIRSRRNNQEND